MYNKIRSLICFLIIPFIISCHGPEPLDLDDGESEISYTGEAEESTDDSQPDEIHCPVCSLGNKANSKFCKQCGGSLENAT